MALNRKLAHARILGFSPISFPYASKGNMHCLRNPFGILKTKQSRRMNCSVLLRTSCTIGIRFSMLHIIMIHFCSMFVNKVSVRFIIHIIYACMHIMRNGRSNTYCVFSIYMMFMNIIGIWTKQQQQHILC